jgi:hypothetical protein
MLPWPAPFILMVDRGDCTFVKKVCAKAIAALHCLCAYPLLLQHIVLISSRSATLNTLVRLLSS